MLGIRCVGMCGRQSDDLFVCYGVKPTQRACARDLPRVRKRRMEGRSQKRQKETVSRRERQRLVDRTSQLRDESRAERRPVNRSQKGDC